MLKIWKYNYKKQKSYMIYFIYGVNMGYVKGLCPCGNKQESKGWKYGKQLYGRYCTSCRKNGYTKYKKDYCEACGFKAINKVQLDIDHIDGNHKNNDISNLQTLCSNCHRLKTFLNNDHIS